MNQPEEKQTVSFVRMEDGTAEDYAIVAGHDAGNMLGTADRVIDWLLMMDGDSPYRISRLDHCLQTATRAENDGADDETVICALLHDIGDVLGPANHSEVAAALLRPYVSGRNYWIVRHHGLFQGYYYFHHQGQDRNARQRFRGHEYYQACVDFCANWDQVSFDPDFPTKPLEHFEQRLRALFDQQPKPFV